MDEPRKIGSILLNQEHQIHVDETPDGLVLTVTKGKVKWEPDADGQSMTATGIETAAEIPLPDGSRKTLIEFLSKRSDSG